MKIAVKYCGGCNPYYDRVAAVEELRKEFPEAEFSGAQFWEAEENAASPGKATERPDLVLVVCGCQAVCAEHGGLEGRAGKIVTASAGDFAKVRDKLRGLRCDCGKE